MAEDWPGVLLGVAVLLLIALFFNFFTISIGWK